MTLGWGSERFPFQKSQKYFGLIHNFDDVVFGFMGQILVDAAAVWIPNYPTHTLRKTSCEKEAVNYNLHTFDLIPSSLTRD